MVDIWQEADDISRQALHTQWEANQKDTGGHAHDSNYPDVPFLPFKWDNDRRAHLRAELDAYYARLYGLTCDELRYILDPADVYGSDFPAKRSGSSKKKKSKSTANSALNGWYWLPGTPNKRP